MLSWMLLVGIRLRLMGLFLSRLPLSPLQSASKPSPHLAHGPSQRALRLCLFVLGAVAVVVAHLKLLHLAQTRMVVAVVAAVDIQKIIFLPQI
jgi:hypothetical protein